MTVRDAVCYWLGYIIAGKEINTRRDDGPSFRLADGRVLFVHDGISSGRSWGTYWRMPNGSLRRLRSLPIRATREEAEHDLAAYAAAKGLARIEPPRGGEER